ncbi:membrane protein insertion efficiency factor YidD [Odoribacter sp. OttesenSCG-928-J03]|nr:membrane protein insertion efficiency factor YidD [Odoribacter sp. OttesenSCG-928-J03]MDL2330637.1 membrane protein insertion efficiency factor YidD [Odoribacter sp. OttesenSCG-928-A06]
MSIVKLQTQTRHSSRINEEMPSQFEQDISEAYVCNRELNRPDLNIRKAIRNVTIIVLATILVALILNYFFYSLDLFTYLPLKMQKFQSDNPKLFFFLFSFSLGFLIFLMFLRKILIGMVKLYQHYAPEEVRRRCLFKPTCSEYTILALKKYGVIIGLYKAYIRIFKKCRGNIYRIDYP